MISIGTCVLIEYGLELFPTFLNNLSKLTEVLPEAPQVCFCLNTTKSPTVSTATYLAEKINSNKNMIAHVYNNIGLIGLNLALQAARFHRGGALLINDDIILEPTWFNAIQNYPKNTGMISFRPINEPQKTERFTRKSFVKGHVHFITKEAIEAGFYYDTQYCTKFGPFDVFAALQLTLKGFNTYTANEASYTELIRPNAKYEQIRATLYEEWQLMETNIRPLKKQVLEKYPHFWSNPPDFSNV